jgi:hypothetical protein
MSLGRELLVRTVPEVPVKGAGYHPPIIPAESLR